MPDWLGLTVVLQEGGRTSRSQVSGLPGYIARPWEQQWTGHQIWCLSSICSLRGIMDSLKYSFVSNDDDRFAIDWLWSKVRLCLKISNSKCLSEFLCSKLPTQFLDYLFSKCFSQTQCMPSTETQGNIKHRNISFCVWRTHLLLRCHLQLSVGHCVLGTA